MSVIRIGQCIRLKPEYADEYIKIHAEIWPSVLKRITDCHIHDYSIFYDKQANLLFASMKYTGSDYEGDMKKMAEDPETQRWWKVTDEMQQSLDGAKSSVDGGWWRQLEEVFHAE